MTTLTDRLNAIRERVESGGAQTMQLGGDPNAKVWPAETWKICDSQSDVLPLLEAVEAVRSHLIASQVDPEHYGEYGHGVNVASRNALSVLNEHLAGGDDE